MDRNEPGGGAAARAARGLGPAAGLCAIAIAVHVALRIVYFAQPWRIDASEPQAFVAAEGVVGLMARSILRGARPVFYWGQFYLGAFEAYLAAAMFALFGSSMTTLRLVAAATACAWIPLAGLIGRELFGARAGMLAAVLVAVPSPFVFEWGFVAWGGHAHAALMLLELYLLLVALRRRGGRLLAGLGFVLGLSVWVNQLAVPYLLVAAGALLLWGRLSRREAVVLAFAGVVGMSPLLYGNVVEPLATVRNLGARVKSSWRLSSRLAEPPADEHERFYRSVPILQVLGAQPRRDGRFSAAGVSVAVLLVVGAAAAVWRSARSRASAPDEFRRTATVLAFVCVSVLLGVSGFFGQPVGRYQVPLYPLLGVLAAGFVVRVFPAVATPAVGGLALLQFLQICAPAPQDGRTPVAAVVSALERHGLDHGYAPDYAYDVVFASDERVLVEPLGWSKHDPYGRAVAAAPRVFYLYRDDQSAKVSHRRLMAHLESRGTRYGRFDVGAYHVLHDFQPRADLGAAEMRKLREEILAVKNR